MIAVLLLLSVLRVSRPEEILVTPQPISNLLISSKLPCLQRLGSCEESLLLTKGALAVLLRLSEFTSSRKHSSMLGHTIQGNLVPIMCWPGTFLLKLFFPLAFLCSLLMSLGLSTHVLRIGERVHEHWTLKLCLIHHGVPLVLKVNVERHTKLLTRLPHLLSVSTVELFIEETHFDLLWPMLSRVHFLRNSQSSSCFFQ